MFKLRNVKFSAVSSGIKKEGLDLGLVYFQEPVSFLALYTTNRVKAAHIHYMKRLEEKKVRALLVNSGCANAATGKEGVKDLEKLAKIIGEQMSVSPDDVLFASTGVIGKRLPVDKIIRSFPELLKRSNSSGVEDFAKAIMTTDSYHKISTGSFKGEKNYVLIGVAKGAGMINPKFGTMLCFLFTDFPARKDKIRKAFKTAIRESFEKITVDAETSTNDTVVLFFPEGDVDQKGYEGFVRTLNSVTKELALLIVRDGEGATKVIHIKVKGARTKKEAEEVARRIARSNLVKTAFFGSDPNWGRIIAAVGDTNVRVAPHKIEIIIQGERIVSGGEEVIFDEATLKKRLETRNIDVEINLNEGKGCFDIYTTDLTYEYIKINASYRT
ncbi:MAG: bifunctional glutamate N-acetyltransferase/amino-acid acetyltransferase ArgJ [Deltaproteobacteria bacterium]|nr:bifunctional glutamate N-acetyltransferase/amino-acid acetyltransferase ArgJ [Deltaproteobacteria bacterium]